MVDLLDVILKIFNFQKSKMIVKKLLDNEKKNLNMNNFKFFNKKKI